MSNGVNKQVIQVGGGGGGGSVTNVSSTSADLTVANPTTTPALTLVSAPKLTTARNINGVAFDGTTNITVADATKQPLDAGLTSISALTGAGYVKATATDTFSQITTIPNTDITGLGTLSTQNGTFSGTSSGTNTGDVTLAGTPNYITIAGQVITRTLIDLTTHVTGLLPFANIANVATGTIMYRKTAATGPIEAQTLATLKTDLGLTGTNSGDQTITLTGDITGSGTGSFATTLATVNSNVGSFGLAGSVAQFVVNAKGLITSAVNVAISITASQVSDFTTAVNALITGKANTTTTISTTAPLSGGGDLSANRTFTTSMATNKLIGRGTAGTGVMEEITLGTNLSLTGTTLNASGSGGTITTQDEGSTLSTTVTTLNFVGAGVTASGSGATTTITIAGGGGSLTKGIAEVDFGTKENDIATITISNASITTTSYPSATMYALATTDHDPDDYMAENLSAYITNVINGVSFDISVNAPDLTWGKYKVTYQF